MFATNRRTAFTLVELLAAMLGSMVLILTLVGTIRIAVLMLEEAPIDEDRWVQEDYARLISDDLRYANEIDNTVDYTFDVTRPNRIDGSPVVINYTSYIGGLTRQHGSEPTVTYDEDSPGLTHGVDGYTAATDTGSYGNNPPVLHAAQAAGTDSLSNSLTVQIPDGVKPGDLLLLCVSAKFNTNFSIDHGTWQTQIWKTSGTRVLHVRYAEYQTGWPSSLELSFENYCNAAAILMAIGEPNASPMFWSATNTGSYLLPGQEPSVLDSTAIQDTHLNVQVFAGDGTPFGNSDLGVVSFVDVGSITGGPSATLTKNSLAVVVRHGRPTDTSTTPTVIYNAVGSYVQAGIAIQGTAP